jgi:hypothetical protein
MTKSKSNITTRILTRIVLTIAQEMSLVWWLLQQVVITISLPKEFQKRTIRIASLPPPMTPILPILLTMEAAPPPLV